MVLVLLVAGAPLLAPALCRVPGELGHVLGIGYYAFLAVGLPLLVAGMILMLVAAVILRVLRLFLRRWS